MSYPISIGKGIDPAIAATFAIPAESVTDESDNENLLEPPVDQEQSLIH